MIAQFVSEFRKMTSTWSWWLVGAAMVAATAALVLVLVIAGVHAPNSPLDLADVDSVGAVYATGSSMTYVFTLVVGVLIVTSEFQSGTIGQTLLANPDRVQVFLAKVAAAAVSGALFGVLALLASVGGAAAVLSSAGLDPALTEPEVLQGIAGTAATLTLWAVIGAGAGAVIRHQLAAILAVIVLTQALEPLLRIALPGRGTDFLPGGLADAASGGTVLSLAMGPSELSQAGALGLMLVLAAAVATLGALRFRASELV